jgi:hypothetical protein
MNAAENLPTAASEALRRDHDAALAKAVTAELWHWARLRARRTQCDCCKRTSKQIGERCRKPVAYHYRVLRDCFEGDAGCRDMFTAFAKVRLFDDATSRPTDMRQQ